VARAGGRGRRLARQPTPTPEDAGCGGATGAELNSSSSTSLENSRTRALGASPLNGSCSPLKCCSSLRRGQQQGAGGVRGGARGGCGQAPAAERFVRACARAQRWEAPRGPQALGSRPSHLMEVELFCSARWKCEQPLWMRCLTTLSACGGEQAGVRRLAGVAICLRRKHAHLELDDGALVPQALDHMICHALRRVRRGPGQLHDLVQQVHCGSRES
jgi:hypothetical protein